MAKQQLIILLFLSVVFAPIVAQTPSTQGKEFWVTLTIGDNGDEDKSGFAPYLAISAKLACEVTVSNPLTGWNITRAVPANSWTEIKNIPLLQWYPSDNKSNSNDPTYSEVVYKTALQVTATESVSLYAAHRMDYSFDAANILPTSALMDEYIIQDYPPSEQRSVFAIVATENNTTVNITPSAETVKSRPANTAFSVTLQKGEVYEVISKKEGWDGKDTDNAGNAVTFSGSYIKADKKIAVFNGCVRTRIPSDKAARDLLYEQAMPTAYWGTQFVVTKSMNRNADRVRITALNNDTKVKIDGTIAVILQSRETFEFEISDGTVHATSGSKTPVPALTVNNSACFVETTCPCAIYLYTVGKDYDKASMGDPAMVWISPIEQRIQEITFGVCGTDKTKAHYVNVITETTNVPSMQLLDKNGVNQLNSADFQIVPYNPGYSYVSKNVANTTNGTPNPSFTLKGNAGFVAHVYGHGDQESYAYSIGSATVQRSIKINGEHLVSGNIYPNSFCVGDTLAIETNFGNNIVDSVSWDMDDGVTKEGESSFLYVYDNPGEYHMEALTKTTNPCTGISFYDTIQVKFKVTRPDSITHKVNICEGENYNFGGTNYSTTGKYVHEYNCDSIVTLDLHVGAATHSTESITAFDSLEWHGNMYYETGLYEWHTLNAAGCDSTIKLHLQIKTCLEMEVDVQQTVICEGADMFTVSYLRKKGEIAEASLRLENNKTDITFTDSYFIIPIQGLIPNEYNATLMIVDTICNRELSFPVHFTIRYPNSIFAQKWNDVLAVYNKNYNGGYTFSAYQWYKNEIPIEGATASYYYVSDGLDMSAEYTVELTRVSDGVVLKSCPLIPTNKTLSSSISVYPTTVKRGTSVRVNTQNKGTVSFLNLMGILQSTAQIMEGETIIVAPQTSGVYVLSVQLENGTKEIFRVVVK